jgi:hypothetical protein
MVSSNFINVTKHEFVRDPNPGLRAGVVQFYEFVTGTNPGG